MSQQTANNSLTNQEQRLVQLMSLLGDRTRYKMFRLLLEDKSRCVGDIAEAVGISASAASQHFRNFEMLGVVDRSRSGQRICYELRQDEPIIRRLIELSDTKEKL